MRATQVTPVTDAKVALQALKDGNKRYIEGKLQPKDNAADRTATIGSQKPFASILTCADSRCCPETYFDAKIGDLFILRNAGNWATDTELGAFEFGAAVLGAPLIVVVGHQNCGAVHTAVDKPAGLPEKLQGVIDTIIPGVEGITDKYEAIKKNAEIVVATVKKNPVIQSQGTMVVAAYYNFETGEVTFFE